MQQHPHAHAHHGQLMGSGGPMSLGINELAGSNYMMHGLSHHHSHPSLHDAAYGDAITLGALRRRGSQPYPSPHATHHNPHSHHNQQHHGYGSVSYASSRGSLSYPAEDEYAGVGGLPSPVEDSRYHHSQYAGQQEPFEEEQQLYHRSAHHSSPVDNWHRGSTGGQQQQQQQQISLANATTGSAAGARGGSAAANAYFPPTPTSASAPTWDVPSHPSHASEQSLPSLASMNGMMGVPAMGDNVDVGDEPLLASHVSLGSNRLPPDSTLLTSLPGFQREEERWEQQATDV